MMETLAEAYIRLFRGAIPFHRSRETLLDFWYGEAGRRKQYGLNEAQTKYLQHLCRKHVEALALEKLEDSRGCE